MSVGFRAVVFCSIMFALCYLAAFKIIPFAAWTILKIIFWKGRELRLFGKVGFCSIALCALTMCLNSAQDTYLLK